MSPCERDCGDPSMLACPAGHRQMEHPSGVGFYTGRLLVMPQLSQGVLIVCWEGRANGKGL